jgi:hypothetical protein
MNCVARLAASSPQRGCASGAHVAEMAAVDEDEVGHVPEFADLRRSEIGIGAENHAGRALVFFPHDAVAGQVHEAVTAAEQGLEDLLGIGASREP